MQSHTLEMRTLGSSDSQAFSSLVGSCPTLIVKMGTLMCCAYWTQGLWLPL